MSRKNNFSMEGLLKVVIIVFLFCSAAILAPVTHGSILLNNKSEYYKNLSESEAENKLKLQNTNKVIIPLVINFIKNRLRIPSKFIDRIINHFDILNLNRKELKNLLFNKIIPFHNELKTLFLNSRNYSEILKICNETGLGDFFVTQPPGPQPEKDGDYKSFKYNYEWLDNVWHKRTGDQVQWLYGIFPITACSYYEWKIKVDDYMTKLFDDSRIMGGLSALVIAVADSYIADVIGCIIIFYYLFQDAMLMAYAYNSCCFFDTCEQNQVQILIHLVYNESGISNYDGDITAWNVDAYNTCEEKFQEYEDKTVWQKPLFTYNLGEEVKISNSIDNNGWYSLSNRYYHNDIYEKAPCPPGNWTIHISNTSNWIFQKGEIHIENLQGEKLRTRPYILEVELVPHE